MNKKNLILLGGGGHCKSVIDVAESAGYNILGELVSRYVTNVIYPREQCDCKVGERCFIGSQSVLANGIQIGNEIIVGIGSFIGKSYCDKGILCGNSCDLLTVKF